MREARHLGGGGGENAKKRFIETTQGRSPLRIPVHGCDDNIKIYLREIILEGVDWIHLSWKRDQGQGLVYTAMNLFVQ